MNTLREVLDAAERAHVAVGHFNFSDLVTLKAVATSAHELRVPVMVGVSEGERANTLSTSCCAFANWPSNAFFTSRSGTGLSCLRILSSSAKKSDSRM